MSDTDDQNRREDVKVIEIGKQIHCSLPLCENCQRDEFHRKVYARLAEAGIDSLYEENESEVDEAVWDEIDAATGVKTREIVQRIVHAVGEYSFMYPSLVVDYLSDADREAAERSGAEVTGHEDSLYFFIQWELPNCGLFSSINYRMSIDYVPSKQLRRDAIKYAKDKGKLAPKGDTLVHTKKNTARHRYSNYDELLSWHKSLARPLTDEGAKAIKDAYNEEIDRLHPDLKTRS